MQNLISFKLNNIFNTDSKKLGYFVTIQTIFMVLIGTFQVPLIFRLTNSITTLTFIYLFYYSMLALGYSIVPYFANVNNIGKIFKLSLLIQILFCLLILLLYNKLDNIYLLSFLFSLLGFQDGVFWLGKDSGVIYSLNDDQRDSFVLKLQSVLVLIPVIISPISGFIISYINLPINIYNKLLPKGYFYIFILMLIILVIGLLFSPKLKFNFNMKINMKNCFLLFKSSECKLLNLFLILNITQATILVIGVGIINFMLLKTEFNLGIFSSILSLFASIYFIFIKKKTENASYREKFLFFGTVGVVISRITYFFSFTVIGLLIKSIVDTFLVPFKDMFADNVVKQEIEKIQKNTLFNTFEILIYIEILIYLSRFILFMLILFLLFFIIKSNPIKVFQVLLFIFGITNIAEFYLLKKMSSKDQFLTRYTLSKK